MKKPKLLTGVSPHTPSQDNSLVTLHNRFRILTNFPSEKWLLLALIFIGLSLRVYLAVNLPITADEVYSTWDTSFSYSHLLSDELDPTHTPGYYLLLKTLTYISGNVIVLRLIHLLTYIISAVTLYAIGKSQKISGLILPTLYTLSGYFLAYEWQLRSYAMVTALILISLYLNLRHKQKTLIRIITHTVGLYLDYGYVWYFFPWLFYSLSKRNKVDILIGLTSLLAFTLLFPQIFHIIPHGIAGVTWLSDNPNRLNPLNFIPFFLGLKQLTITKIVLITLALYGTVLGLVHKSQLVKSTLLYAGISGGFCLIFSLLISPLFHYRSLIIIALAGLFAFAYGLEKITHSLLKRIIWLFLIINFVFAFNNLFTGLDTTDIDFLTAHHRLVEIVSNLDSHSLYYSLSQPRANMVDEQLSRLLASNQLSLSRYDHLSYHLTSPACPQGISLTLPGKSYLYLCPPTPNQR